MLTVASSVGTIPMPSELSDEILLNVICSYSSRYPSLQWAEEFASVSPQWKQVVDSNWHKLPRLMVDTVHMRGCQLAIWLQANDQQQSSGGPPQPIILNDQAARTASMLRRLAAKSFIISLGKVNIKQWPYPIIQRNMSLSRKFSSTWVMEACMLCQFLWSHPYFSPMRMSSRLCGL